MYREFVNLFLSNADEVDGYDSIGCLYSNAFVYMYEYISKCSYAIEKKSTLDLPGSPGCRCSE